MILKYQAKINGEHFKEQDTFIYSNDNFDLVYQQIIVPWNKKREKLGEPLVELVRVEVVNPYVHLHDWERKRRDTYAMKQHFKCRRCGIMGFHKLFSSGLEGTQIFRSPPHDKLKYELCKDELRKMPTGLFAK